MAKLIGFNIGGASGHVGDIVYYTIYGNNVARSMPRQYTDNPSEAQLVQRLERFKPATAFTRAIKYFAPLIFETKPQDRSRFSQMVKQMFPAWVENMGVVTFDPVGVIIGNGSIPQQDLLTAIKKTTASITVTWDPNKWSALQHDDDQMNVLVTMADASVASVPSDNAIRSVGTLDIDLPSIFTGQEIYVSSPFWSNAGDKTISPLKFADPVGLIDLS